jgi:hypothetical protein
VKVFGEPSATPTGHVCNHEEEKKIRNLQVRKSALLFTYPTIYLRNSILPLTSIINLIVPYSKSKLSRQEQAGNAATGASQPRSNVVQELTTRTSFITA